MNGFLFLKVAEIGIERATFLVRRWQKCQDIYFVLWIFLLFFEPQITRMARCGCPGFREMTKLECQMTKDRSPNQSPKQARRQTVRSFAAHA